MNENRTGELNGNSNWTDRQARMIREYRAGGFTFHDLSKLFDASESTLAELCNGESYQSAGGPIAGRDYPRRMRGKSLLLGR